MREPTRNRCSSCAMHRALAVAIGVLRSSVVPAVAADAAKILRVALTSSEMSFDPQFSYPSRPANAA